MRDLKIVLVLFFLFAMTYLAICLILINMPKPENSIFAAMVLLAIVYIVYGVFITFNPRFIENKS